MYVHGLRRIGLEEGLMNGENRICDSAHGVKMACGELCNGITCKSTLG